MRLLQQTATITALLGLLLGSLSQSVVAQVRKCEVDGKVVYQQGICPATGPTERPTAKQLNAQRQEKGRQSKRTATSPSTPADNDSNAQPTRQFKANPAQTYRCDGRTRCPQMTSCAEAKYFLANCPGVKMDGDHDGIPCEEQWCK